MVLYKCDNLLAVNWGRAGRSVSQEKQGIWDPAWPGLFLLIAPAAIAALVASLVSGAQLSAMDLTGSGRI